MKRGVCMNKEEKYLRITKDILKSIGEKENLQGVAHCATRLRLVVSNIELIDIEKIEEVELVKGVFIVGGQLQIIFGAGLVNEIYNVFSDYTNMKDMSLQDVKKQLNQKQNIFQQAIKSLSDVFIEIMPAILAAAPLMGISGLLNQQGIFGELAITEMFPQLVGVNKFISIVSSAVFSILPLIVVYSATKRYGGRPILGLVVGAIMLSNSLSDAYQAAQGLVEPEVINLFGLNVELIGYQGGIIVALMMGIVVAKLDQFFEKKVPNSIKLLLSPILTVFLSALLLMTVIGPIGRLLASGLTNGLLWGTENLGILGYMIFGGVQQLIVITGLHHLFGAIEGQLLADTGRDFINPLASVAVMAQGGAVLGYLVLNWNKSKVKEMCIPAFTSTLFGISEPAIFGVTLRNKFPLVAGCIASALAGGYIFMTKLTAIGYGTTVLPGVALVDSANNGYFNYLIAHVIALVGGVCITIILGKLKYQK